MFVWIIVFYFYNLCTHMHFITNGYKRFSKTYSTDPRQRVPLIQQHSADGYISTIWQDLRQDAGNWPTCWVSDVADLCFQWLVNEVVKFDDWSQIYTLQMDKIYHVWDGGLYRLYVGEHLGSITAQQISLQSKILVGHLPQQCKLNVIWAGNLFLLSNTFLCLASFCVYRLCVGLC